MAFRFTRGLPFAYFTVKVWIEFEKKPLHFRFFDWEVANEFAEIMQRDDVCDYLNVYRKIVVERVKFDGMGYGVNHSLKEALEDASKRFLS